MIAALIGAFSGIVSGMGIGGGTILIPALSIFLNINQHNAQGVNLLYFIPTAVVALFVHFKNKSLDFKTALPIILSGVAGAAGGAIVAGVMSADILRKFFAIFLFAMGLYEIFKKKKQEKS
ncbi:MAG: sulfite exporter TauE/SafE family protein [Ruminococcaceae bacterium]|nr:sulfite exporter TauE/SafE family protein [Oscillospiraceae bacterium]